MTLFHVPELEKALPPTFTAREDADVVEITHNRCGWQMHCPARFAEPSEIVANASYHLRACATAFLMEDYEVRFTTWHVILTCRLCHKEFLCPVAYPRTGDLCAHHPANAPHPDMEVGG